MTITDFNSSNYPAEYFPLRSENSIKMCLSLCLKKQKLRRQFHGSNFDNYQARRPNSNVDLIQLCLPEATSNKP